MSANAAGNDRTPVAVVLGLNEIASAVAIELYRSGYTVVMAHDPARPVIRRGMAFYDAVFDDKVTLGGVTAVCVDSVLAARLQIGAQERFLVTRLDFSELLLVGDIEVLVDARLRLHMVEPQLRKLARFSIGTVPASFRA